MCMSICRQQGSTCAGLHSCPLCKANPGAELKGCLGTLGYLAPEAAADFIPLGFRGLESRV